MKQALEEIASIPVNILAWQGAAYIEGGRGPWVTDRETLLNIDVAEDPETARTLRKMAGPNHGKPWSAEGTAELWERCEASAEDATLLGVASSPESPRPVAIVQRRGGVFVYVDARKLALAYHVGGARAFLMFGDMVACVDAEGGLRAIVASMTDKGGAISSFCRRWRPELFR